MLSTDGKGSVLCKSCETVLYQLSRAVVFLLFFSSLQTYRLSTHCMEVNGSSVEQSQVQSRADSEPRATVCKHTVALVLPMETWLGQLRGEEWDGVMASAVPD